jgi:HPt (histidine-containing phosphotransfer) domain-containing protein
MIDWGRVTELKTEIGEDDMAEVVELFLSEVEEELDTLPEAVGAKALAEKLHFLKGSALNLGLVDFSRLCQAAETAAAGGDRSAVDTGQLRTCFAEARAALLDGIA